MPDHKRTEGKNDRQSHGAYSREEPMKKGGHGAFNYGNAQDDLEIDESAAVERQPAKTVDVVSAEEFEKMKKH
ncbi:hypothetical protein HDU98_000336 [Podochytrium sp. JEL0797]|nr:hypothetical protein HDU98_000336 [Podochytrium sp. JEL0797]